MGIPRFFRYISNQFPNTYQQSSFNKGFPSKYNIDNLYLDANGIIHNAVREVYFPKKNKFRPRLTPRQINPETQVFELITNYIDNLLHFVKPTKLFFIAIDGPAPLAKQAQQRQRRYKAADTKTQEELAVFDSTAITPGTEFMYNLSKYIQYYIKKSMTEKNNWSCINVIFSGSDVPGEGEHKIVDFIRNTTNKYSLTHCMYGLDADLFMLSLATHCDKFYLLREDQFNTSWNDTFFYIVDIGQLRNEIENQWGSITSNKVNLINDFIFICFLIGNDFLHALPPFYDLEYNINFIMDLHKQVLQENYITKTNNSFNLNNFILLLSHLQKIEESSIASQFYKSGFPNITLNNSLKDQSNPSKGIYFEKYRNLYYKKIGIDSNNKEQVWTLCKNYLEGLDWVNYYYHNYPNNWLWFYPYHYSPLIVDLLDFLNNSTLTLTRVSQTETKKILPFQQLLCVVPPKSKHLLPKFLQPLYYSEELKEFYPEHYEIDCEGKTAEWECIALLPFIDFEKIETMYDKTFNIAKTTGMEINEKRNIVSQSIQMFIDYNKKYTFKSSYGIINNCRVNLKYL
jgi:5'-3' exonuclease